MPQLCVYLQLHQPYRLGEFNVFDLNHERSYFDHFSQLNQSTFTKVSEKSYLPMLALLHTLLKRHSNFHLTLSVSGVFLDQARAFQPRVITLLQKLADTGQVEFLAETYYHSLASLYSPAEFRAQVAAHHHTMTQLFNQRPTIFRNTELVYSNDIGELVAELGYQGMLTEAVDRYLYGRERTQVFTNTSHQLFLLLKHAQLSDDIAFRFSNRSWPAYPLTVDKYVRWLEVYPEDHLINLFMDFETFGEHQWADTGIFTFFESLIDTVITRPGNAFVTPTQVITGATVTPLPEVYDVPQPISWADIDRDLTAWIDNDFQQDTLAKLYALEAAIKKTKDKKLLDDWRKLQTSDHFYYMCTKWSADGDVHAYFSPYDSPYEAYRRYSVVLADLQDRVKELSPKSNEGLSQSTRL